MKKIIDFDKNIFEISKEYPEFLDIMYDLGFKDIKNPCFLNTVGKIITIKKGSKIKNISLDKISDTFKANGFDIINENDSLNLDENDRISILKSFLIRINNGEDINSLKEEFINIFENVDPAEIVKAEQEIINSGTPIAEIKKLCDLHSTLFHDITNREIHKMSNLSPEEIKTKKKELTDSLIQISGHPLETFSNENKKIAVLLEYIKNNVNDENYLDMVIKLKQVSNHYKKKGDLIYPNLNVKYNISGPSNVMWAVDNDLRSEINILLKTKSIKMDQLNSILERATEMIYKEENILFPICAMNFTEEDWINIYHDSKDYGLCLDVVSNVWQKAEEFERDFPVDNEKITLPGGSFTIEELRFMLDRIPAEITFVDKNDINRYFNDGEKLFKRPLMALGRDVYTCHPPQIEPMVRSMISDFKNNKKDEVRIWKKVKDKLMMVEYLAVRDKEQNYLGTLELVHDMTFAEEYFKNKQ